MKIISIDLNKDYSDEIQQIIAVLNSSGTFIYPTDTLYGIGCNALNVWAVERVFRIKERSFSKPFPILAKNIKWAKEMAHIDHKRETILEGVWPGKVTAILPKKDVIPDIVTAKEKKIGIRVADYVFTDKLLGKFGYPIVSTSANISNEESTNDINKIIEIFSKSRYKPDLIVDVGILPESDPSIVIDLTADKPKVLRAGPSKPDELLKILEIQ